MSDQSHTLSILLLLYKKNRISCASSRQTSSSKSTQVSQASLKPLSNLSSSRSCTTSPSTSQPRSISPSKTQEIKAKVHRIKEEKTSFCCHYTSFVWCAARSICSADPGVPQHLQSPNDAPTQPRQFIYTSLCLRSSTDQ